MMTDDLATLDKLIEGARRHLDGLLTLRTSIVGEAENGSPPVGDDHFADANLLELPLAAQRVGIARGREAEMTSYSLALAKMSRLQGQGS
ncbi:hypothetical protein HFO82_21905 [Rhizobium leguminosarum]|uniref:hypothetical protein n=1 Tax=Rhizobium leguminosarum TaxID=384 RepID=UPI001C94AB3B|nr:hypothetical protein [Rhizobium leguminosarum]MBY5501254.1 hypothetical protein [Rhizobium leguminosarum]